MRELRNAIERAVILARDRLIDATDLQPRYRSLDDREVRIPVGTALQDAERLIALKTFAFTGGDHGKTARILGVEEKQLRGQLTTWLGGNGISVTPRASAAARVNEAFDEDDDRPAAKKPAGSSARSTRSAPPAKKPAKPAAKAAKSKPKSRR